MVGAEARKYGHVLLVWSVLISDHFANTMDAHNMNSHQLIASHLQITPTVTLHVHPG